MNPRDFPSHLDRKVDDASLKNGRACRPQNAGAELSSLETSTISCEARLAPSGCRSRIKRGYLFPECYCLDELSELEGGLA